MSKTNMGKTASIKDENVSTRQTWLASFPELNPNPILEIDLSGSITYMNPSAKILFKDFKGSHMHHPMLKGLEKAFDGYRHGKSDTIERDIRIDDAFYREFVHYIKDTNTVRIYAHDIFGRKRAENALLESEERYYNLADNFHEVFWIVDPGQKKLVYLSPSFETIFGVPVEHVYDDAHRVFDMLHPDDRQNIRGLVKKAMNGELDRMQWPDARIIRPDGVIRWISAHGYPVKNEEGKIQRFVGIAEDVTDRKLAENEVLSKEARLDSILKAAPIGIGLVVDRVIKEVNARLCDMMGYTREELVGKSSRILYPSDSEYEYVGEEKYRIIREKGTGTVKTKWLRKDGVIIDILLSSTPLDQADHSAGVTFTALDITENIEAMEALRENEMWFRITFEQAPVGIAHVSLDYRFIHVNQSLCNMLGYTYEELTGMATIIKVTHPDDVDKSLEMIGKLLAGDIDGYSLEKRYLKKDGSVVWANITMSLIRDKDGNPRSFVPIIEDITKRKKAEAELIEAKATAELYVDLMSHDINNMNQISLGFLELALDNAEMDDMARELIVKSYDSMRGSSKLIDNVKKIQREKAGHFKQEVVDVGSIIKDVKKQYAHVPCRDVNIAIDESVHCYVIANELLKEVFLNLVGNAIKHSSGPLNVTVAGTNVYENGKGYCKISIEDDGPGITDDLKSRLFDRLSLQSTRASGKGFGLCLTKILVDDYKGRFWVEDRVEGDHTKGCRFNVMLPKA